MIPATLGPYRIDRELGSGGMGSVYAATLVGDSGPAGLAQGAVVALKVVHAHLVDQPGFRERFEREARSGLTIVNSNVVRTMACLDVDLGGRTVPALVLEYVEGRDLAALLAESNRVPEDLCRHLAREIALGLDAIHAAGVVHRDLKPGNVLLTASGGVKVMDLGLARQAGGDDRLSQTGLFLGTAAYAPPEQFFGKKELDPRSDLYSLGAMLFELTTGRVPFRAEAIGDLVRQVLRDVPPRVGALAPQTTPFFEEVVATLLAKDPARRFTSAAELCAILDAGESHDWWTAASARLQAESRRPLRRVRVRRETELWGREDDLAELRSLWDVARGGSGRVVLLEGEAGIGKTRLVDELLAAIEDEDDVQVLVCRHDPSGAGAPADALGAALLEFLGADALAERLAELLPDTPLLVPAFAALLMAEAASAGTTPLTQDAVRTLFARSIRALSAEAPLVLVVDDLHFATDEARALFRAIAFAAEGAPLLLVGTARLGLPAKWTDEIASREYARRLHVQRLDEDTVRTAIARHLGGGYLADAVAERVASRAGGNPYFVVEVLRRLGESGQIARTAEGAWRVTSASTDLAIPETVRDLVGQRLAALVAADRELLEAASCQGAEFDGRLLAETVARPRIDVLRALGRLEYATSLVRAAGTRFAFDHHVVHEVLHDSQDDDARRRNHRAIGTALEARHGDVASAPGGAAAEIADHLLRGGEGARALRWFGAGLAHLDRTFRTPAAADLAARALAESGLLVGGARGKTLVLQVDRFHQLARRAEQRAALDELVALAAGLGDRALELHGARRLGMLCGAFARYDEARVHFERTLVLSRELGDKLAEVSAYTALGNAYFGVGRGEESYELQGKGLALAKEIGSRAGEQVAEGNLGNACMVLGRPEESAQHLARQAEIAREIGDRRSEVNAIGNLGSAFAALGRFADALDQAQRALTGARSLGDRHGEAIRLVNIGPFCRQLGDLPRARDALLASLAICREIGARYPEGYALHGLAQVADDEDDLARATAYAEEALALRRAISHGDGVADTLQVVGDLRRRAGDVDGARSALDESLVLLTAQHRTTHAALALATLACLPGGDAMAAEAAVAGLGAASDGAPVRLLLWQATGDRAHLVAAKRDIAAVLAKNPVEHHAAMLANVRVFREVTAAVRDAGM